MPIIKPILPPRKGYVEVEVNGVRRYRSINTGMLLEDEQPATESNEPSQIDRLKAQVSVLEAQQTFLEDCILEMADVVYA